MGNLADVFGITNPAQAKSLQNSHFAMLTEPKEIGPVLDEMRTDDHISPGKNGYVSAGTRSVAIKTVTLDSHGQNDHRIPKAITKIEPAMYGEPLDHPIVLRAVFRK